MKAKHVILTILLFAAAKTFAQDAKFTVSVDKNPVSVADTLEVTFAVNAAGEKFTPPDFNHFRVIDEAQDDLKINGKLSRSFKYRLTPLVAGEYLIGPAAIMVSGQQLTTTPLKIKAINGQSVSLLSADELRAAKFQQRMEKMNDAKTQAINATGTREEFLASVEPEKSDTAGVFKLLFSIKANADKFSGPDLKDFEVISGPNQTASVQSINGVQTDETMVYYELKAMRNGEFTIKSASVFVNGALITASPLKILIKNGALVEGQSGQKN